MSGHSKYRRTSSYSARAFVRLRRYCQAQGLSLAGFVEQTMMGALDSLGAPDVSQHDAVTELKARKQEHHEAAPSASGVWSF